MLLLLYYNIQVETFNITSLHIVCIEITKIIQPTVFLE